MRKVGTPSQLERESKRAENLNVFTEAGYEIEEFGGANVIVRACPTDLTREDISALVREMAGKLAAGDLKPVPE